MPHNTRQKIRYRNIVHITASFSKYIKYRSALFMYFKEGVIVFSVVSALKHEKLMFWTDGYVHFNGYSEDKETTRMFFYLENLSLQSYPTIDCIIIWVGSGWSWTKRRRGKLGKRVVEEKVNMLTVCVQLTSHCVIVLLLCQVGPKDSLT